MITGDRVLLCSDLEFAWVLTAGLFVSVQITTAPPYPLFPPASPPPRAAQVQIEGEKRKIEDELARQREALEAERREKAETARRLQAMQEQLIQGGVSLLDKAQQQESELRRYQREMAEQQASASCGPAASWCMFRNGCWRAHV